MADREDQSNLPPIPDGGLSESMPDWLRRPPAWRTLPDREVTAPEPEETAGLPEPDTSIIDPRTFLSDEDLPAWLRNLGPGRRGAPLAAQASAEPSAGEPQPVSAGTEQPVPNRAEDSATTSTPARFVPTSPQPSGSRPVPTGVRRAPERPVSRSAPATTPSRQGVGLIAVLAGLLVIAIVVIVVLLVA